ncbi:MAG: hypothetical protein HKN72_16240 [Gemmatimonadetes bacterium]|nr:hypothetical protein [Gemmatimonadota bacterium]
MRRTVEIIAATTVAATLALGGCTESSIPTQPVHEPAFFEHEPAPGFSVIRRDAPLARDLSVTRTLGQEGGELELAGAGIRLLIPAGALSRPTDITLRARAGSAMAFELAPGGLELVAAATLEVSSRGTDIEALVASAAPGSILEGVLGVVFEDDHEGAVEPVGVLRAVRSDHHQTIVVEIMSLLAGYATASG